MVDTKDRILLQALELFARDGYEAVSVRDIAGRLGMAQSALYKHYKNKRDIFDSIVKRMSAEDERRAREYEVPEDTAERSPQAYMASTMASVRSFTLAQFDYWTKDAFAAPFRKLLTLEQYRNEEMAALLRAYLTDGVVGYVADLFAAMTGLEKREAELLALEYYAPVYLLICVPDGSAEQLKAHIDKFSKMIEEKKNGIH